MEYSIKLFQEQLRVDKNTFFFLCQLLYPSISKIQIPMNPGIDVQTRVIFTLHRLATRNTLSTIGDLYGISESAISMVVSQCCQTIVLHLKPLVIEPLTKEQIVFISQEFEGLHDLP